MKIKVIYRTNLKMSANKLAAQVGHAVLGLSIKGTSNAIIVLGMSNKKYRETREHLEETNINYYEVIDSGKTEVPPNTNTCLAFIEKAQKT